MRLPNGQPELAQDTGGVLRDALSEFWETFYNKCTLGTNFKVPYIRHDYGKKQWSAIENIIHFRWKRKQYFPLKLAPLFIKSCLELAVNENCLLNDFLLYVS